MSKSTRPTTGQRKSKSKDSLNYIVLTEDKLRELARKGDAEAKRRLTYKRLNRFLKQNEDLCFEDRGIGVGFVPNDDGFIRMQLDVPEGVTWEDFRRAKSTIIAWRERLTNFQGLNLRQNPVMFYSRLANLQAQKISYQKIAEILNAEFLSAMAVPSYAPDAWIARRAARDLLSLMGLEEDVISYWMQDATKMIREGFARRYPKYSGPISRARVISRLRIWRESK